MQGVSNVMFPRIKLSMNIINVGIFLSTVEPSECHNVIAQTYCLMCCITTHLVTISVCVIWQYHIFFLNNSVVIILNFILHHRLSYAKVQEQFQGWYLDILLWGHLKGQVQISSPQMPEETKVNIKTQDCSNYGRTAMHGVYKQQKEVTSFHRCRRRSLCTHVAIIKDDLVKFFLL